MSAFSWDVCWVWLNAVKSCVFSPTCTLYISTGISLKDTGQWTLLVIVKYQSSHLLYLNICIKQQTFENNMSSVDCRSCEITMKEKNTPVTQNCVPSSWLRDLKNQILRSRKQIRGKLLYFLENYVPSEGEFTLTMFYVINLARYSLPIKRF